MLNLCSNEPQEFHPTLQDAGVCVCVLGGGPAAHLPRTCAGVGQPALFLFVFFPHVLLIAERLSQACFCECKASSPGRAQGLIFYTEKEMKLAIRVCSASQETGALRVPPSSHSAGGQRAQGQSSERKSAADHGHSPRTLQAGG